MVLGFLLGFMGTMKILWNSCIIYENDKEKINKNKNDLLEVYDYRLFDIYLLCLVVMMALCIPNQQYRPVMTENGNRFWKYDAHKNI